MNPDSIGADAVKDESVTLTGVVTVKDNRPAFSLSTGNQLYALLENEDVEKLLEKSRDQAVTLKGRITQYKGNSYLFIDDIQKK